MNNVIDIYSQNVELDTIAQSFDTDKVSGLHDFLHFYERRLKHLRSASFVMFEVGVLRGGSLATWSKYFANATVVGIDVNNDCSAYENGNAKVRIGDASDSLFLYLLINEFGRPTIFLDDGSHRWDHQIETFKIMFPLLQPGGFYIMEDIDTSFQAHLEKAPFQGFSNISAIDYLYKLMRVVTGEHALKDEKPYDLFISQYASQVGSVEFGRRTVVISKKMVLGGGPV